MTLDVGTCLGAYEITGALGAGGMGEVYRATDTKLGREVAIKTLPSALAHDSDRLARFEREAKLLAALNHTHIAAIYGLDEHEGTQYLAMELVEGETLEEKLKAGPLPVEDALHMALQIAEALEGAHEKGVVHRDLKPANVMITPDGVVKVLDFGLAKTFSGDAGKAGPGDSPALSLAMTQQGLMLGTAGYMSPEQASGQATDQRADVWAFGVVLYEMLTGMPLFSGESVPHILADVLKSEPDWSRLPKNLHPRLEQLLERCLEKRVRDRYHSIADARVDIEKVLSDPRGVTVAPVTTQHPRRRGLSPAVAVVATAGLAALVAWRFWPSPAPKAVNRFSYVIPDDQSLGPTQAGVIALSPDGRRFVYNTTRGLYRREMGELEARLIPGTEQLPLEPFFSPDGKSIGYWGFGPFGLRRIGVEGGASVPVVSLGELRPPLRESWGADGAVYYAFFGGKGIYRIPATGGEPKLIVRAAEDEGLFAPRLLPDRDSLLFVVVTNPRNIKSLDGDIVVQSLATGERKTLISGGADARYVPTGHIVYVSGDTLFGVAFDLETLSVSGGPEPLVEGISRGTGNGSANYDVAENGTLVYLTGDVAGTARTLVWVDRGGREEPLNLPPRNYQHVELSPDGHSLALEIADQESDIWIFDRDSKTLRRLTLDSGVNRGGIWSPDGKRVVFTRQRQDGRDEIDWQAADGSGVPEPLLADSRMLVAPSDVTPDGTALLYSQAVPPRDILMLPIGRPDTEPVPLLARPASEFNAQVSPNGRWLAYQSSESESQIYVVPFPAVDSGAGWQISSKMGMQPRWSRDGRELFYLVPQPDGSVALMAVPIESEPSFRVTGLPVKLFEGNYVNSPGNRTAYDVSPDGQRFLMLKEAGRAKSGSPPRIVVVENWFEELKRRVPTK